MKGDFSRNTFDPTKHYSGVLMQQGRVQVDADWNEQHAINQHRTLTEAGDVIGRCAVPEIGGGFAITVNSDASDLIISSGRIYVDGILCQLEAPTTYSTQSDYPNPSYVTLSQGNAQPVLSLDPETYVALVYLDVWQRHITVLDDPHIREVALGGPDTTTRVKTIWQVKMLPLAIPQSVLEQRMFRHESLQQAITTLQDYLAKLQELEQTGGSSEDIESYKQQIAFLGTSINSFLQYRMTCGNQYPEWDGLTTPSTGTLNAQTQPVNNSSDRCLVPPGAGYQLLENQLYRVEIHQGTDSAGGPTFKWSRDNGSVVVAIQQIDSSGKITIQSLGPDDVLGFANADRQLSWVEVVDDWSELNGQSGPLVQVQSVDHTTNTITVEADASVLTAIAAIDQSRHPKLRRWDQVGPSATSVGVVATPGNWQDLEGNIQVQFSQGTYKAGDYWLIPARTAAGTIDWPQDSSANPPTSLPQLPLGIQHHYCRLGLLQQIPLDLTTGAKTLSIGQDCRTSFPPLASPTAMHVISTNWQNDDYFGTDRFFKEWLQVNLDAAPSYGSPLYNYQFDYASRIIVTLEVPFFGHSVAAVGPLTGAKEAWVAGMTAEPGKSPEPGEHSTVGEAAARAGGQVAAATLNYVINGYSWSYNYHNVLYWAWTYIDKPTLDQSLVNIMNSLGRPPYMRVTVKGHAIWSDQGGRSIYLDGQAFGRSGPNDLRADQSTPRTALMFPSGAGERASDFESWFYMVPPPLQVTAVNFISYNATSGQVTASSAGQINLPPIPQYPNEAHFNSNEHINAIDITFSLRINAASLNLEPPFQIQVISYGVIGSSQREVLRSSAEEIVGPPPHPGEVSLPWMEAALPPYPAIRRPDIVARSGGGGSGVVQGTVQPLQNPDDTVTTLRFVIADTTNFPQGFTPSFYYLVAAGGNTMPDGTTPTAITSVAVSGESIAMPLDGDYNFVPGDNFYLPFNVL
jgi:Family of unknown function (DUF6519)